MLKNFIIINLFIFGLTMEILITIVFFRLIDVLEVLNYFISRRIAKSLKVEGENKSGIKNDM